jgi:hypothetical protein
MDGQTIATTVLLKVETRRLAEQAARDARRSLSNYLSLVIEDCVGMDGPGLRREPPERAA